MINEFIQNGGFGTSGPMVMQHPEMVHTIPLQPQQPVMIPQMPTVVMNGLVSYATPMTIAPMGMMPMMQPQQQSQAEIQYDNYGNVISIGGNGYNQGGYNPYAGIPQQPINHGYVFQPVIANYTPYPTPKADYNNPYPQYNQGQPQYGYNPYGAPTMGYPYYGYGYNPYYGRQYVSLQAREKMLNDNIKMAKMKYKIICAGAGREYVEEEADKLFNPNNPVNVKSQEEIQKDREWADVVRIHQFESSGIRYISPFEQTCLNRQAYRNNFHQQLDGHSMCQFLEEDLPRLMREFWIAEHIKHNANRDLINTYDSQSYRDLLAMHHGGDQSAQGYAEEISAPTVTDSNLEEIERGVEDLIEKLRSYSKNGLENRPSMVMPENLKYMASPEVQKQRRLFNQELLNQMYEQKGGLTQIGRDLAERNGEPIVMQAPPESPPEQPIVISENERQMIDSLASHGIHLNEAPPTTPSGLPLTQSGMLHIQLDNDMINAMFARPPES